MIQMKQLLALVAVIFLAAVPDVAAQQSEAKPPAPPVPNLRFDVSILDEGGGAPVTRKTVTVMARADNQTASVRSYGRLNPSHPIAIAMRQTEHGVLIGLKVDVRGRYENGRLIGRVTVEYQPYAPEMKSLPSSVTTQVDAIFDEGRKMVIAQAADPLSDRKTTIEVTVTVLK
jgi:hypothetical protein